MDDKRYKRALKDKTGEELGNAEVQEMDYNEYKEALKEKIEEQLENVEVRYTEAVRNNSTKKEVLALETKGEPAVALAYMEDIYRGYECIQDLEESRNWVVLLYKGRSRILKEWVHYSWEQMKPHIRIQMVRMAGNEEYLESRPYKKVLDMAVVFAAALQEGEEEISARISWHHMDKWGIDMEELYQAAVENLEKEKFSLINIANFLPPELQEEAGGEPIFYSLTTKNKIQGARAILRRDLLEAFSDKEGGNFFILPSSVHEILLFSERGGLNAEELAGMVREINRDPGAIKEEDVLTDSVYYYDREKNDMRIAA